MSDTANPAKPAKAGKQAGKQIPGQHDRHPVPDARRPRQARAGLGQAMAGQEDLRAHPQGRRRPPEVHPARRPAVRQRRHPPRPRGQQDPEGHDRQVAHHGRLRRALRAGLGLPRHADRDPDRKTVRQEPADRRSAAKARAYALEQIERQNAGLHPPGRAGRMGQPVHDHGLRQRGRRAARARHAAGKRLRLSRPEAGQLVLRLRLGAGRSGSRIPGQARPGDRRRLPVRRTRQAGRRLRPAAAADRQRLHRDLDHHAVDHPVEPGAERASGSRLRAGAKPSATASRCC